MKLSKPQDEQARQHFEDDQPPRPRMVVDCRENDLREPLVIDPASFPGSVRVGIWLNDGSRSQDVLPEAHVAPEIRVCYGVGKPKNDESDEQACRTEGPIYSESS